MKWMLSALLLASNFCAWSQKGDLVLKFNGNYGMPTMSQNLKKDNILLGAINQQAGLNLGLGYKVTNKFQMSALFGVDFLNINKKTFEKQVLSRYLQQTGSLYRLSPQRAAAENYYLALEFKYSFTYKGWQIAPLLMSRLFSATNPFVDIELYEKTPNEHYYKNTKWQRATNAENSNNNEASLDFSPAYFSAGIEFGKSIFEELALVGSLQYTNSNIQFEMNKIESYFDQKTVNSSESFYQRYRAIAIQLGFELTLNKLKKESIPHQN